MPAGAYRNPPIEEAICEFSFAGPSQQGIDFSLPGKLQSHPKLSKIYTGAARAQNLQTIVGGDGPLSIQNALHRIQIASQDTKGIISIGSNILSVSVLKPYEGWDNFKHRIADALHAYREVTDYPVVTRIGLRYINRIVSAGALPAGDFLIGVPPHYPQLQGSLAAFAYRSEYRQEDQIKIILQQATLQPMVPGTSEYLLDVDVVSENINLPSNEDVLVRASKMHSIEGQVFESLITEKSRAMFDEL